MLRLPRPPRAMPLARHSGPGLRYVLYTQGCVHRCTTRCLNPELLSPRRGIEVPAIAVTDEVLRLLRLYPELEGVTVLGGEPFEQAAALHAALRPLRDAGLSVMLYSGHTLATLREDPERARLLELADILVDGPFLPERSDRALVWRGSHNQSVRRLTGRYSAADLERALAQQRVGAAWTESRNGALTTGHQQRD